MEKCRFFKIPDGTCGLPELARPAIVIQLHALARGADEDVNDAMRKQYLDETEIVPSGAVVPLAGPYQDAQDVQLVCTARKRCGDVFAFSPNNAYSCNRFLAETPETKGKELSVRELMTLVPTLPSVPY